MERTGAGTPLLLRQVISPLVPNFPQPQPEDAAAAEPCGED